MLDAYAAAGGNFVDTANSYLVEHGRSETIIGRWMAERGNRDEIVLATKVGGGEAPSAACGAETIAREAPASLERLQTDRIDLYYAHFDDEETPLRGDAAGVRRARRGRARCAISAPPTTSPERLTAALELQREHGLAEFTALQPHYNLVERDFEGTLLPVADAWDLAVLPVLRAGEGLPDRQVPPRRRRRRVAARRGRPRLPRRPAARRCSRRSTRSPPPTTSPVAAVALAWLRAQPRVVAPIASARTRRAARARSCRRRRSS